jgi:hypothetical protein
MSSGVETSPILVRFLKQRLNSLIFRFARCCPRGFAIHVPRPGRSILRFRCASLGMTANKITAAALASLPQDHLGFPAENAKVAGTRRHIRRLNAFAGKRNKAHRARV